METDDKEFFEKLQEYKEDINNRMSDMSESFDDMRALHRENIRMRCLEAALKFYELKSNEPLVLSRETSAFSITKENVFELSEEIYKFVKGKSLKETE